MSWASAIGAFIRGLWKTQTYGTEIERFIMSRYPKHAGDVEQAVRDFYHRQQCNYL